MRQSLALVFIMFYAWKRPALVVAWPPLVYLLPQRRGLGDPGARAFFRSGCFIVATQVIEVLIGDRGEPLYGSTRDRAFH